MKHEIIFASSNSGKIHELQHFLADFNYIIIPQQNYKIEDAKETGLTFVENALLKARHAAQQSKKPAIADDSGLVVPALGGAPGIYSARYAGKNSTAQQNITKLLADLNDVAPANRQAYFHCSLVYLEHAKDPAPLICEGIWHGIILPAPLGSQGFGYDPVFYDAAEQASAAELVLERKNKISHRGQALRELVNKLQANKGF